MIIWDKNKKNKLYKERGIIIEEVADIIIENNFIDILDHPKYKNQNLFIVDYKIYIHAVAFSFDIMPLLIYNKISDCLLMRSE